VSPNSQQQGQKGEIDLAFSGNDKAAIQVIRQLERDLPIKALDAQQGAKAKKPIGFMILYCDFQCSPADCCKKLNFALSHRETPFVMLKFLRLDKRIQPEPVFFLSLFEAYNLSLSQENMIDTLRSSGSYSRNLISRLHPRHIVSKVLTPQNEIAENHNEIIDCKISAETIDLSPSWLSHKFKEISGIGLERFILQNRLCRALWKIISTDELIKKIALNLGYKPASFSERFKEHFGATPSFIRDKVMFYKQAGPNHSAPLGHSARNPQKNRYQQK
jgi:AraC-like DNA-binding protein